MGIAIAHLVEAGQRGPNARWRQIQAIEMWRGKSQGHAMAGRRHTPAGTDAGVARDGGLWRGPSEEPWIVQLLHGLPPPRDSAHPIAEVVSHG